MFTQLGRPPRDLPSHELNCNVIVIVPQSRPLIEVCTKIPGGLILTRTLTVMGFFTQTLELVH